MPKAIVCALFDRAAGVFASPVTMASKGVGVRQFIDQVNDPGSPMNKHPTDYELHMLGEFDDETGRFDQKDAQLLARAEDVKVKSEDK